MNDMEAVYTEVQHEADATRQFSFKDLGILGVLTLGVGLVLTLIGALQ